MTMGIVLVACLAAWIAPAAVGTTRTSTLSCTSSVTRLGSGRVSLSAAKLDHDVFPFDVTEISQPLPQCLDVRPGIGGAAGSRYVTDPRDLRRLLRRDGKTKDVEQSAKGETRDFLTLGSSNGKSKTCGEPRRTIENDVSSDDSIRPRQHVRRNRQTDLLGRLEIDDQLELHRLLYRKIGRFGAFYNFVDVNRRTPIVFNIAG